MKAICRFNSGSFLPESFCKLGYTSQSEMALTLGKEYAVLSMCLCKGLILYLIYDESHRPNWHPAAIFQISERVISPIWEFGFWGDDPANEIEAVWGYHELVNIEGYFDQLSERVPEALDVFEMRRKEIENS